MVLGERGPFSRPLGYLVKNFDLRRGDMPPPGTLSTLGVVFFFLFNFPSHFKYFEAEGPNMSRMVMMERRNLFQICN